MTLKSDVNFPRFSECPSPWTSLRTGCYRFLEKRVAWNSAKSVCYKISGHLVKVETEEEQVLLVAEMNKRRLHSTRFNYMWIGLNDLDDEGVWRWSDSTKTPFSSWRHGQPNSSGGEQDCAVMDFSADGKWNDFWCDRNNYNSKLVGAICEL